MYFILLWRVYLKRHVPEPETRTIAWTTIRSVFNYQIRCPSLEYGSPSSIYGHVNNPNYDYQRVFTGTRISQVICIGQRYQIYLYFNRWSYKWARRRIMCCRMLQRIEGCQNTILTISLLTIGLMLVLSKPTFT